MVQKNKNNNNLKKVRENMLLSKSELARKAGISSLTIDRIEKGYSCRMDTKRKILEALGLKIVNKNKVFGGE
jgi:DNA-binding XRE family transcriptional regulator